MNKKQLLSFAKPIGTNLHLSPTELMPLLFLLQMQSSIIVAWGMVALLLSGCATPGIVGVLKDRGALSTIFNKHLDWDEKTKDSFIQGKLQLGMGKGQVLYLQGSPASWSKYKIGEDVYESWSWEMSVAYYSTCDFKNGILIGYHRRGRYYSSEGIDDVRKYEGH